MCGRETLTTVVSSTSMKVANITATATIQGLTWGCDGEFTYRETGEFAGNCGVSSDGIRSLANIMPQNPKARRMRRHEDGSKRHRRGRRRKSEPRSCSSRVL